MTFHLFNGKIIAQKWQKYLSGHEPENEKQRNTLGGPTSKIGKRIRFLKRLKFMDRFLF